ncbi:MAG: hypothetical protein KDF54_11265 [Hydrogenophaga sp.]|nr:hypothetical protein [Hydrogenophaga sp.]
MKYSNRGEIVQLVSVKNQTRRIWLAVFAGALAASLSLSGCGGGGGDSSAETSKTNATREIPSAVETQALLQKGAQLNAQELQTAASRQATGNVRTKSLVGVPVYRFYNTQTAAHFYTISEEERATVQNTLPHFQYDGPAFTVSPVMQSGLSPVYRFFNTQTGVHFYTISEEEKALIQQSLPQFKLEGVAYYASKVAGSGLTPLYRFYLPTKGFHFYTISRKERDSLNMFIFSDYGYEGESYYVMGEGDSFEISMFNEVNAIRSAGGFGVLNHNIYLDAAARNHGNYMMLNYRDGRYWNDPLMDTVDPATGWLTAHTEQAGTPGFTGTLPADRAIAAGYQTNYVAEVISPEYSLLIDYPYEGCVDDLLSSVFHRNGLLYYGLEEFGSTVHVSQDRFVATCILEPATIPTNNRYPPVGWVGVYPLPDQTNVATMLSNGGGEAPDPLPSVSGFRGNPISIYIRPYDVLTIHSFELRDASGALVTTTLLTEADFPFYLTSGQAHLVPHAPLQPNTRYTVHFTGLNNGVPLSKVWSFTTRSTLF